MKRKNVLLTLLNLVIIFLAISCDNKPIESKGVLYESFLGIPINSDYSQIEKYIEKLYSDSIIEVYQSFRSGDSVIVIRKEEPSSNTIRTLKMIGVDSVTSGFTIYSNLMLEHQDEIISHDVITDLYFYNDRLVVLYIRPKLIYSSITMESLLDTYSKKYGNPEYINKVISENRHGNSSKYDIYGFFSQNTPYVTWKEYYSIFDETRWSFKNASIKLVNFHSINKKINISASSYTKAENYLGKKYGKWSEPYLDSFLSICTILNRESKQKDEIGVFYINEDIVTQINKDIKRRNDEIQMIRLQKQKEEKFKDSLINEENKKKYDKQKI